MTLIQFHPDAEVEMIEAAAWYESRQEDLGKRFLAAVRDCINRIVINPRIYPEVEGDICRCLVKSFPFGVLFKTMPEGIGIVAVMHLRRDPDYWKRRRL